MISDDSPYPTLLISYCRADKTKAALVPLRNIKTLYLFCDGEKENENKTESVKQVLQNEIDRRSIEGKTTKVLFLNKNAGTAKGPIEALKWFFSHEKAGHVIEDDIVVHPAFFEVHADALTRYGNTSMLWVGSGYPLQQSKYRFIETAVSKLEGWSSWSEQVLCAIDWFEASELPWDKKGMSLLKGLQMKTQVFLWKEFTRVKYRRDFSWAYVFLQHQLNCNLRALTPTTRLHENIGFDGSGTNCLYVFGKKETWTQQEVDGLLLKENASSVDKYCEGIFECHNFGKIAQSIGRKLLRITPKRFRWIWRPSGSV